MPWQVKAIATLGVSTILALWFPYWLTNAIEPAIRDIQQMLKEHVYDQTVVKSQNETIIRVLRANCVNQAANREDRDRCQ
jgi:hypothetical protein